MRFFGADGILSRSRRFVAGNANVQDDEVKDATKLAEILRGMFRRLSEAEALIPPEAMEFEVDIGGTLGARTDIILSHNMHCSVRFTVVYWTRSLAGTYPTTGPILVVDETTDDDNLVLRSYAPGRAIIRIEPSFKGINLSQQ